MSLSVPLSLHARLRTWKSAPLESLGEDLRVALSRINSDLFHSEESPLFLGLLLLTDFSSAHISHFLALVMPVIVNFRL